jgi:hypothetical protein
VAGIVAIARSPEFRGIVRRVLETDPIGTVPRRLWDRSPQLQQKMLRRFGSDPAVVYRSPRGGADDALVYYGEPARVSGARAEKELGYHPIPAAQALASTLEWARYARLLPAEP